MYRMVVSDLDGTLLNSSKQISKRNVCAVRNLIQQGIPFVAATGRSDVMTKPYMSQLGSGGIVIGCDGALVRNTQTGEILYSRELSTQTCQDAFELCGEYGLQYYIFTENELVGDDLCNERLLIHQKFNKTMKAGQEIPIKFTERLEDYIKEHKVYKIVASHDRSEYLDCVAEVLKQETDADAIRSGKRVLAVKAKGVSKASALKKLAGQWDIPMEDIIAFGDEVNDIEMLKAVGLGIAMENADRQVKEAADFVAASNDADGVGIELEKLFGNLENQGRSL